MRRALLLALAGSLALLGAACGGEDEPPACADPVATTEVELADFAFEPACVEAAAGDTLTVANTGDAPHSFTLSDVDLSVDVPAGDSGTLTLDGVTAGTTYRVTCVYHPQMTAALRAV